MYSEPSYSAIHDTQSKDSHTKENRDATYRRHDMNTEALHPSTTTKKEGMYISTSPRNKYDYIRLIILP